jgi:site-specific DNA recombinase
VATAAIYTRLSQDRDGTKGGTKRQEEDCRALCRREGLRVGRVYTDDDRSAYSAKSRPSFEQLLGDLEHYDALVYWKTDRLVRRTVQFFRVVEACQKAGVRLVSVVDPIDTSTPIGQGVAGLLASVGEQESHNIGLRVKRLHESNAKAGKPHGHRRAFGYDPTGTKIVAAEAKAIREARDRILKGESMTAICNDWNDRGVKCVTARAWRVTTFRKMITGTVIAGLRRHNGDEVVAGTWPAIITPADRKAILGKLGGRTRGRPARYLLTGLICCGKCGGRLRSGVKEHGVRIWTCRAVPGDSDHCGALSVRAEHVDELVEDALLYRLDSPALARALRSGKSRDRKAKADAAKVVDLENKVTQLGLDHDDGVISRKEWLARRGPLVGRLEAAKSDIAHENGTAALQVFEGADVYKRWAKLALDQRRAVIALLIERVTIHEPAQRGNTFDPDRVEIVWRA